MGNFWAKKKAIKGALTKASEKAKEIAEAASDKAQQIAAATKETLEEAYEATKEKTPSLGERAQYRDKFFLLNKSEMRLYQCLQEAAPALLIFSQVSMSQLFHINRFQKGGLKSLGEIGRKSVDFLLCRADDSSILLAIELNGPTHEEAEQKAGDEKKRIALQEAGIPLVVLYPSDLPDVAGMRRILAPHIIERKKYEAVRNERLQR